MGHNYDDGAINAAAAPTELQGENSSRLALLSNLLNLTNELLPTMAMVHLLLLLLATIGLLGPSSERTNE